jgi:hypothetical protein
LIERAFLAMVAVQPYEKKLAQAQKEGRLPRKLPFADLLVAALEKGVLNQEEITRLKEADALRYEAIQVDHFEPGVLEGVSHPSPRLHDAA